MEEIYGPYGTETEAHAAVIRMAGPGDPPVPSVLSQRQKWQLLSEACDALKLDLGGHDKRVLSWVATWEDSTVAVIAGLISRAGNRAGPSSAEPAQSESTVICCPECDCEYCDADGMDGDRPRWQCPACYCVFTTGPETANE